MSNRDFYVTTCKNHSGGPASPHVLECFTEHPMDYAVECLCGDWLGEDCECTTIYEKWSMSRRVKQARPVGFTVGGQR